MGKRMRFGAFMGPFHARRDNPTLALHRDLELVTLLDRLGYDECWFGEHHSGGMEIIGPPEMVVCTAAERTRNIRLGTGVVSLAYHNPLMVAERINYLDHITRGRVMFGVRARKARAAFGRVHDGHRDRQAPRPDGRELQRADPAAARRGSDDEDRLVHLEPGAAADAALQRAVGRNGRRLDGLAERRDRRRAPWRRHAPVPVARQRGVQLARVEMVDLRAGRRRA